MISPDSTQPLIADVNIVVKATSLAILGFYTLRYKSWFMAVLIGLGAFNVWATASGNTAAVNLVGTPLSLMVVYILVRYMKLEQIVASRRLDRIADTEEDQEQTAVIGADLTGKIVSWSLQAERLYGYKPDEVIGRAFTILMPDDKKADGLYMLENVKQSKTVKTATQRLCKDGSIIDVEVTAHPVKDPVTGKVIGVNTTTVRLREDYVGDNPVSD